MFIEDLVVASVVIDLDNNHRQLHFIMSCDDMTVGNVTPL